MDGKTAKSHISLFPFIECFFPQVYRGTWTYPGGPEGRRGEIWELEILIFKILLGFHKIFKIFKILPGFHNPKLGQHAANVTLRDTRERDRAETESLKLLELPTVAYYRGTVQNPKTCSPRERPYLNYSSFRTLLRGGNAWPDRM